MPHLVSAVGLYDRVRLAHKFSGPGFRRFITLLVAGGAEYPRNQTACPLCIQQSLKPVGEKLTPCFANRRVTDILRSCRAASPTHLNRILALPCFESGFVFAGAGIAKSRTHVAHIVNCLTRRAAARAVGILRR